MGCSEGLFLEHPERFLLTIGPFPEHGVFVGEAIEEDELADVVKQSRHEDLLPQLLARSLRFGDPPCQGTDAIAVIGQPVDEGTAGAGSGLLSEDSHGEHQRPHRIDPQEDGGRGGGRNALSEAEIGGVDHLQDLGRHPHVLGDEFSQPGDRRVRVLQFAEHLRAEGRWAGERRQSGDRPLEVFVGQVLSECAGSLDRGLNRLRIARLRQELVRWPYRFDERFLIRLPRERNTYGLGVLPSHSVQQRHAVHAGHADVGHQHVEWFLGHLIEGLLPASDEDHLPLAAQTAEHSAQSLEDVRLIVNKQNTRLQGLAPRRPAVRAPWADE